tara:strand:- start:98 stop:448 length:351 start_codon:yes stop_codon:yes gene_type:complete
MRLHLDTIHRLSLGVATQELHRAVQDVYATRSRDAWRHFLNHMRALRLFSASDLEIEGGVESLHAHASLPVKASPAKNLPDCLYSALRSVVLARKAPEVEALQALLARKVLYNAKF